MPDAVRAPHVLYVAWGFPPSRGAGAYRSLGTANAFARDGWQVTVLTADRDSWFRYTGADASLEAEVDPRVDLLRVPFSWPALESDVRRYSLARVAAPKTWRRWRGRLDQVTFPEVGYGPWRWRIERAARELDRRSPVDLVVGTANPNVDFLPGWHLHQRRRVPYVLDYRDAWTLDVFSGERLHPEGSRAERWERRLIGQATEVWFVNDQIRQWHRTVYPDAADRFHVVANGFDPALAPRVPSRPAAADRPLRFGYLGTVSGKVPLSEFLAGWRLAREQSPAVADAAVRLHGYLGFYATPRADMLALLNAHADEGVGYAGPVDKTDIHTVYEGCDVLLLMLGTGRYVTSSKVYEYVATGLPIVSVHDPGNAASDVLRDYPFWFPAPDLSPAGIAAALRAAADAARTVDSAARAGAVEFAQRYRRDLQIQPRVQALRAAVDGTPPSESS